MKKYGLVSVLWRNTSLPFQLGYYLLASSTDSLASASDALAFQHRLFSFPLHTHWPPDMHLHRLQPWTSDSGMKSSFSSIQTPSASSSGSVTDYGSQSLIYCTFMYLELYLSLIKTWLIQIMNTYNNRRTKINESYKTLSVTKSSVLRFFGSTFIFLSWETSLVGLSRMIYYQ